MKSNSYFENIQYFDQLFKIKENYDLNKKIFYIADQQATIYFTEGLIKDELMQKIVLSFFTISSEDMNKYNDAQSFSSHFLSYLDTMILKDKELVSTHFLSGMLPLLIENYDEIILIDARSYPSRSISEPENDKVIQGAHMGFTESLINNTAMIRRRIRIPDLRMKMFQIGDSSHTDVVLSYLDSRVDHMILNELTEKLNKMKINSLVMSQESLAELLLPKHWYNPFPKIRYTERPDAACANIYEGKIILLIDNSPSCMILPTTFFDFCQNTNDYYFPPIVGTYQKIIRTLSFFMTLLLTPIWYMVVLNTDLLNQYLSFMKIEKESAVPIFIQLMIIEGVIEILKLASLNTPSAYSSSFSIVAALILGDYAIQSELFVPDVVLYMSVVALGSFALSSFELEYAVKINRILLIVLITLFNIWGFVIGILLFFIMLCTQKTLGDIGYLYPLFPMDIKKLKRLFIRMPIDNENC